jgi:F-type H+-transporting ATPase subunit epsilon
MVVARTTEGDVGVLPNHAPMLSLMVDGIVDVTTSEGETWIAAVDAGIISVAGNRISILSEHAEMSHEIDLEKARADLERAKSAGENEDEAVEAAARAWAQARIRAGEHAS